MSEEFIKKTCVYCKGSGNDPLQSGGCRCCKGEKHVLLKLPVKQCAECGGTGKDQDIFDTPCLSCHGAAWVTDDSKK